MKKILIILILSANVLFGSEMENLIKAIKDGNTQSVKQSISKKLKVNSSDNSSRYETTPLLYAISNGNLEIIKLLVDSGADVNKADITGLTPLMMASSTGKIDVVSYLIKKGTKVKAVDNKGYTSLSYAIVNDNIEGVDLLLKQGLSFKKHYDGFYGMSDLMLAAENNSIKVAQKIIDKTDLINVYDEENRSAVYYAVKKNNYEVVKLLIENGARVESELSQAVANNNYDMCKMLLENGASTKDLLSFSADIRNLEIAELLIYYGANVNEGSIYTPLEAAIEHGNFELVKLLFENEARGELDDLLVRSFHSGNLEIVKYLLDRGARVGKNLYLCEDINILAYLVENGISLNTASDEGKTILMTACERNNVELAKYLIRNNVNLSRKNSSGETALMIALENEKTDVAKLLINEDINLNEQDHSGNTALMIAAKKSNFEIVKLLVDKGANPYTGKQSGALKLCISAILNDSERAKNLLLYYGINVDSLLEENYEEDITPIMIAAKSNNYDVAKVLIENGADLNRKRDISYDIDTSESDIEEAEDTTRSILAYAIENNNLELAKLLIDNGAKLDIDYNGKNLLMLAAKSNSIECMKLLISKGIKVNQKDKKGKTAIFYAIESNSLDAFKLLMENKADLGIVLKSGETAAKYAVMKDSYSILYYLILTKEKIKLSSDDIFTAVKLNSSKVLSLLVAEGIDFNTFEYDMLNGSKYTPFTLAVELGHYDICRNLIEGAVELSNDSINKYALLLACYTTNTNYDIIDLLIQNGMDLLWKNEKGYNCLMYAVERGNIELIKYILDKEVSNENLKKIKEEALPIAKKGGQKPIINLLQN